jgi:flagellar biosynthesis protein FlhB
MAGGKDNKSEQPTARKLRKTREKGQVARSKEVSSAAVLFGGLLVLMFFGQNILQALELELKHLLSVQVPSEITIPYLTGIANSAGTRIAIVLVPVLLGIMAFSVLANMMQGGLVFSTESLGFHFEKLSPQKGLGRIFSKNGLVELLKSGLMLIAIGIISYQVISAHLPLYPRLILMDVRKLFYWTATISFQVFIAKAHDGRCSQRRCDYHESHPLLRSPILQSGDHGRSQGRRQGCRIFGAQDTRVGTRTWHSPCREQTAGANSV